jgi:solute carrier family 10 (sodium/bile acid cotransporter), member 7
VLKSLLARLNIDVYILMLLGTVGLASVLPARGAFAPLAEGLATAAVTLLFFLHGAKLSREAVIEGISHWRLHILVMSITFVIFPLIGLGVGALPFISPMLATGFLFLTLLPSTVQSSIAFTAIARGNVAAAVCSASFSNLAGIFLTPALVALLMRTRGGGMSFGAVEAIVLQLLLPFFVGHMLRPWVGPFVARHKSLTTSVDRGSILLVVYTAFGAAVVKGIWHQVSAGDLAVIAAVSAVILALVLAVSMALARAAGFTRPDSIVVQFCGSKKSLASGVPMAGVLFPAAQVGAIILPLMLFHQIQLMVCAFLARRYAEEALDSGGWTS